MQNENDSNEIIELYHENYGKDRLIQKRIQFLGKNICIEILKGQKKYSQTPEGIKWQKTMQCSYGYFADVIGQDGENLDCYISEENSDSNKIFIIKQMFPDGRHFDENKVILGCNSAAKAKQLYMQHCFSDICFGGMKEYSIEKFEEFLKKLSKTK